MVKVFVDDGGSPLVTIGLPVFNGANTLACAIQSVLDQTYSNIELIIIDDGSTDSSLNVIRKFNNKKLHLLINDNNIGLSASLNKVVGKASGDYFARMDQDDICFPCRLEKQVNFLSDNPEIDLVATATLLFDEKYQILGVLPVKKEHDDICKSPLQGFYMPHPTWMGKTEWFRSNKYISDSNGAEDQNLLFRTNMVSQFACLSEPLLAYREQKRTFKKMFRSRYVLAKSNSRHAMKDGQLITAARIILLQFIKGIGDILNIIFHIPYMRNKLMDPQEETLHEWKIILQKYLIR